ncbi:SCO2400 family protein [Streptomyces nodosus]|uniref:SCO2400 family protein n=1 Tax=Streptomyces nodosus TaxID=40318 RepID=UPI0036E5EC4E
MDYCSSCHRHLNGALMCPGCGAYAPDIAPVTVDNRIVPAAATTTVKAAVVAWDLPVPDPEQEGRLPGEAAFDGGTDESPQPSQSDGFNGAPDGRAARRRQRARWKKSQRRAVVATAVALVGGGMTFAALDRHSADRAQAAPAPDIASMGGTEAEVPEQPQQSWTPSDSPRSSSGSATRSPATGLPQHRPADPLPHSTPSSAHPHSVSPARTTTTATAPTTAPGSATVTGPTAVTVPQQQTVPPSSEGTDSAPDRSTPATSQPSASDPAAGGTDHGTSQTPPAPATTSPSKVCLLVLCLG